MRINRVYLENYRIHERLEIEFSKGINLLLGENGKGKSSILEAIGYALFDSGLRTNNQKEAIKYGKKSAKIEVDFVGTDNEEYKVVRKIPGGTQLFRGDEVLEGRVERVRELCGIKGDMKDIYDNVIVAKQNEFILAFKEKASDREKIFNRVFNTDVYTKIYEGYSREVSAKYEKDLALVENSISNISESLLDSKEIEEKIEFLEENLKVQREYEEILEKKNLELKENLREMRALELNVKQLEMMRENSFQNLENGRVKKQETELLIDESIRASELVEKNRLEYEKYQVISQKIVDIKERKKEIESEREEYLSSEKKKSSLEYELSQLLGEKEVLLSKEEGLKKSFEEKEQREEKLLEEKRLKEVEAQEYKERLEKLQPILDYSLDMEEKLLQAVQSLGKQRDKIFEKDGELKRLVEEKESLDAKSIYSKLEEIERCEEELRELEGKDRILNTQKKENLEAFEMLKSAMCPYLKERCENLRGRDVSEFFNEKMQRITQELARNIERIKSLQESIKNKEILKNRIYRYEELGKSITEKTSDLEKEKLKLESWEARYQLREKEYFDYKKDENFSSSEELKKWKISYETKLNTLDIERYIRDIKTLQKERKEIVDRLEEISLCVKELERKKVEVESKVEELKKYLQLNIGIEERFRNINLELDESEMELKSLERAKEIYIENYKKSLEKERYVQSLQKIEETLSSEMESIKRLESNLSLEEERLACYDKDELAKKEEELAEEFKTLKGKLGGIKMEISYQREKLLEAKKREERLKEEKEKIERLRLKIQLTKSFREKIKNMGKEVSKSMLKEIEITATENFRKITGRGEKLIWSNEDRDKYSVYLLGDRGELKFEQLSGGEQVAVAIAIRGAMSEIFTESKFSIFDEPTNNLDVERRKCLADSIGEILKNLDQSIIVTHDDTFREMAERVIEL